MKGNNRDTLTDRVAELFVEKTWLLRMSLVNPFISALKVLQCGNPACSLSEPSFLSDLSNLQDLKPTLNELHCANAHPLPADGPR